MNFNEVPKVFKVLFVTFALIPLLDLILPATLRLSDSGRTIMVFSFLALGLHIVTGLVGLLNLGSAAFMAMGAYTFGVLTCPIYPFQLPFFAALVASSIIGALWGLLLGLPSIRLRGDYLAIVTLGFGEIAQDLLRNLEVITKGTQGLNPLANPVIFNLNLSSSYPWGWYYLVFSLLIMSVLIIFRIETSRFGRMLRAVRADEISSAAMGVPVNSIKLGACCGAGMLCAIAGALTASYLGSTGEPGNYDFNISILALCMVIVGGLGSLSGALIGAIVMVGLNSILIAKLANLLNSYGINQTDNVLLNPTNWKFMLFGLALVLVMRFAPQGILGSLESKRYK